jgi:hypothetical protein
MGANSLKVDFSATLCVEAIQSFGLVSMCIGMWVESGAYNLGLICRFAKHYLLKLLQCRPHLCQVTLQCPDVVEQQGEGDDEAEPDIHDGSFMSTARIEEPVDVYVES